MAFHYFNIGLTFLLLFSLSQISTAQTTMSGGLGFAFLNIASENSFERANSITNHIYLKESENFAYPSLTARINIDRPIAKRFFASYHFMLFIRTIEVDFIEPDPPSFVPIYGYEGTSQLLLTSHAGALNFEPVENIAFGIGGFYQMIRPSYFTFLSRENGLFYYPSHQAGCLITANYTLNKWSFQLNYMKNIGGMFLVDFADSIDTVEFSVLYQFHQFKTKKERKMQRLQKGK